MLQATVYMNAQKSIRINYERIITYSESFYNQLPSDYREEYRKAFSKPERYVLISNIEQSLFKIIDAKEANIASKEIQSNTNVNNGIVLSPRTIWILKDFKTKTNYSEHKVSDKRYYLKTDFEKGAIKFDELQKTIDGYTCKSAYSINDKNERVQYWYTQEIPITDGPLKITQIPGLVLSYEAPGDNIYATKIEFLDTKEDIEKINPKFKIVTNDELKALKADALKHKIEKDENGNTIETTTTVIK